MMRTARILAFGLIVAFGTALAAQTQARPPGQAAQPPATPPAAKPVVPQAAKPAAPPPAPKPAAPAPALRPAIVLSVTDTSGTPLADVHVSMMGAVEREGSTSKDGELKFQNLKPGTYLLRLEAADFYTLEREVTVKAGPSQEVDVALNRMPVKPAAPPPVVKAPAPPPVQAGAVPADPKASVDLLALPDWIEKNYIGRNDPQKETTVGRTPGATATVVQVRDPLKDRVHDDADEMLYVIAGQGVLRAKGREQVLDAGSFAVIPRGVSYTLERRGRNPLIALSVVGQ